MVLSGFKVVAGGYESLGYVRLWGGYLWLALATSRLRSIHQFLVSPQAVWYGFSYDSLKIHVYKKKAGAIAQRIVDVAGTSKEILK